MNRAQRRAAGIKADPILIVTMTQAQIDKSMPGAREGDIFTVPGFRRGKDGALEKCEPGQETRMRIEIVRATQ